MVHVTILAAFVSGMLTLIPSCGPALLPAFFAYSFRQRSELVKATALFGIGFLLIFVPFGLGLNLISALFIASQQALYQITGAILIVFAFISLFNISLFQPVARPVGNLKNKGSLLLLGVTFGFTTGTCSAPVYGAIVTLAAAESTVWNSLGLLVVFGLGMLVPLFAIACVFQRFGILDRSWFKGKGLIVRFRGRTFSFYSTNIIAALLFLGLGAYFVSAGGEAPFAGLARSLGWFDWFYEVNQKLLLWHQPYKFGWGIVGILLVIVGFMAYRKWKYAR